MHGLRLWTRASGVDSLSTFVVPSRSPADDRLGHAIHGRIRNHYNIHHIPVRVESPDCPCNAMQHRWRAS